MLLGNRAHRTHEHALFDEDFEMYFDAGEDDDLPQSRYNGGYRYSDSEEDDY
jgi:hypothetical protein